MRQVRWFGLGQPASGRSQGTSRAALPSVVATLAVMMGTGAVVGLGEVLRPAIVQAYTTQVSLSLDVSPEESYETVSNRAALIARAAVQRSFDSDLLVTAVLVTVVAERGDMVAPIMDVEVSRSAWSNRPDVAYWSSYYLPARSLLGFDDSPPGATATSPGENRRQSGNSGENGSGNENSAAGRAGDPPGNGAADEASGQLSETNERLDRLPGTTVTLPNDPFQPLPNN